MRIQGNQHLKWTNKVGDINPKVRPPHFKLENQGLFDSLIRVCWCIELGTVRIARQLCKARLHTSGGAEHVLSKTP